MTKDAITKRSTRQELEYRHKIVEDMLSKRFWNKISTDNNTGCWDWSGYIHESGYGGVCWRGKNRKAHRVFYEVLVGNLPKFIPGGLVLDHLCRNRKCCNPMHLELITHKENLNRGIVAEVTRQRHRARTHCKYGHHLDEENTYNYKHRRICKKCALRRNRVRRGLSDGRR